MKFRAGMFIKKSVTFANRYSAFDTQYTQRLPTISATFRSRRCFEYSRNVTPAPRLSVARVACESTLSPGGSVSTEREKRKPENIRAASVWRVWSAPSLFCIQSIARYLYSEQNLGRNPRPIPWNDRSNRKIILAIFMRGCRF